MPSWRHRTESDALHGAGQGLPSGPAERPAGAVEVADLRAHLEAAGTPIGPLDTRVAATARAGGAALVARNLGGFGRAPSLRAESWYRERGRRLPWDEAMGPCGEARPEPDGGLRSRQGASSNTP